MFKTWNFGGSAITLPELNIEVGEPSKLNFDCGEFSKIAIIDFEMQIGENPLTFPN